ncbi:universal stress protein [Marinomonas sp.]
MSNVIACIDGSSLSEHVTTASVWAALTMRSPITLLHSLEKPPTRTAEDLSGSIGFGSREHLLNELITLEEKRSKLALEHGKLVLENAEVFAKQAGAEHIQSLQRHGDLIETLTDLKDETRLIVLGRLGSNHSIDAHTVGSNIERVARTLHNPILISVGEFHPPKNFMIAYDGREAADNAIQRIAKSPLLKKLPCHLVMAGENSPERQQKLAKATQILEAEGFEVTAYLESGSIFSVISHYRDQHKIELMVMGAYAHSKVRQFFVGSNTSRMIIESPTPLLIMR